MTPSDIRTMMRGIAPVIVELVEGLTKPLHEKISALEALVASHTVDTGQIEEAAREAASAAARKAFEAALADGLSGPVPPKGDPGADGKDADPALIRAMVAEAVAELPPPRDAVGVAGAVIDRAGALILTLSDGTVRELGVVVGSTGRPGPEGPAGAIGEVGPAGPAGPEGRAGADGSTAEIEVEALNEAVQRALGDALANWRPDLAELRDDDFSRRVTDALGREVEVLQ